MVNSNFYYQRRYDWPPLGNNKVADFLDHSLSSGQLAQTYIFVGADGLGKSTLAQAFANNLLLSDGQEELSGANSDLYILERPAGKKDIPVDLTRDFIKMLSLSSFLGSYKIGIIKEAETLNANSANSLLKTLEEPREKVVIILLTNSLAALPPTLVSRAQVLYFTPVPYEIIYDYLLEEKKVDRASAKNLAALAAGRPLEAVRLLEKPEYYEAQLDSARSFLSFFSQSLIERSAALKKMGPLDKDRADNLISSWQRVWRDLLLLRLNQPELIQHAALKEELAIVNSQLAEQDWFYYYQLADTLLTAQKYLAANVSPATVLEQVIFNL